MKEQRKSAIGGLVITRKVGDKILINGGKIIVEVVSIQGKMVRLAFLSDKDTSIRRFEAVVAENNQLELPLPKK